MPCHMTFLGERLATESTLIWPGFTVNPHVGIQLPLTGASSTTDCTGKYSDVVPSTFAFYICNNKKKKKNEPLNQKTNNLHM